MKKVNLNKMENLKEKLAVGYKNPPKEHQFKKGQSGNPKGRKPKPIPVSLKEAIGLELIREMEKVIEKKTRITNGNEKEKIFERYGISYSEYLESKNERLERVAD